MGSGGTHTVGRLSSASHFREARGVQPVGVASRAIPLELPDVGQEDLRHVIVHFEGTSGHLERHLAGSIHLVEQPGPALRGVGEPEVPFFLGRGRREDPFTTMDVHLVQV
jgi:hypothetical protein